MANDAASITAEIGRLLEQALQPAFLEVINDSAKHHGHAGDDGSGATHYHIRIASKVFQNQSRVACHRMVNNAVKNVMGAPVHALQITILPLA